MESKDYIDIIDDVYAIHEFIENDNLYMAGRFLKQLENALIENLKLIHGINHDPRNPLGYKIEENK